MKLSPPEMLGTARARAAKAQPYLMSAIYRLRPVEAKGLGTVACDEGWRLYYDPEVIAKWTVIELSGALLHEVWHLLRMHFSRMGIVQPSVRNICQDLEINDDLPRPDDAASKGALVMLPEFGLWPGKKIAFSNELRKKLNSLPPQERKIAEKNHEEWSAWLAGLPLNLTAEEYFNLMPQSLRDKCRGNAGDGVGDGQGGSGGPGSPTGGSCGGCAGNPSDAEKKARAEAQANGTLPEPISPAEQHVARTQVAQAIKAHERAHGRGSVPVGASVWAEVALGPEKIPWRKTLKGSIRAAVAEVQGMSDYTYSRPSRRDHPGFILPALRGPSPEVAVVIDCSGSMFSKGKDSETILGEAMREVKGVLKQCGTKGVSILATDAAVNSVKRVFDFKQMRDALKGGGGTDMGAGLAAAGKLKPKPDITIVLTDGDTGWPTAKPEGCGRVIVGVLPGAGGASQFPTPEWAKVIVVED